MTFEFYVEKLQYIMFIGVIQGDRCPVDQAAHWHNGVVDEQCMRPRNIQIVMRDAGTKRGSSDPNREQVLSPWLSRVALPKRRIVANPLNGAHLTENSRQQITHDEVFDLPVSGCGPDGRAL
jgi:hypothetical protein